MASESKTVLLVGGAGYIGSHVLKKLKAERYNVLVLDNLELGHRDIVEDVLESKLIVGDLTDGSFLRHVFQSNAIDVVMHFASYACVSESIEKPGDYYRNNVAGTLNLLLTMLEYKVRYLVFSSTCATYGVPQSTTIDESHPQHPINPYGMTKLIVEGMLKDFDRAYQLKSVIFRYFNAAGADPEGIIGEDHNPETHLIPILLQAALGLRKSVNIWGTDYGTPDGTWSGISFTYQT